MMRRATPDSDNVAIRRRLRFIRCPVCAKILKTQKLAQHMKQEHRMTPSKSDSTDTLMICLEHKPFSYINMKTASKQAINVFVQSHKHHLKPTHKLKRADRKQISTLFEKEFGESVMDEELVEIFQLSSDEEMIIPPPPKRPTYPRIRDYNVDLDALNMDCENTSSVLPNPEEISSAITAILPPETLEFDTAALASETLKTSEVDALQQAAGPSDINFLIQTIPTNVPLTTLETMLFTDPATKTPGAIQQEYVNTFTPGLANPSVSNKSINSTPLLMTDAAIGTSPPPHVTTATETVPLSVKDAAIDPRTIPMEDKGVGHNFTSTADAKTFDHEEEIPILENSYAYIQSLNNMKNQMIHQLLEDNIAMTQTKQNSRIRALQYLDSLLQVNENHQHQRRDNPYDVSTMDMFSDIFKLKERFIHRLLEENVRSHPQHYNLYELLKNLH